MTTSHDTVATPDTGVLVISRDDRWAHAYADLAALAAEHAFAGSTGVHGLDFFDLTGRGLYPELAPDGAIRALKSGDEQPDTDLVRARLHRVLALISPVVRQRQAGLAAFLSSREISLDQALLELPPLDGTDLTETLRRYRTFLGPHTMDEDKEHRGSVWHNIFVHGF